VWGLIDFRVGVILGVSLILANIAVRVLAATHLNAKRYRVTNRRIIELDSEPSLSRVVHADEILAVIVVRGRRFSTVMPAGSDGTLFGRPPDPSPAYRVTLSCPCRTQRAQRMGRRRPVLHSLPEASTMAHPPPAATKIDLLPEETVLWSGKPQPTEVRDRGW